MPALGLLILAAQVVCAIHVVRTGRPYWWLFLIVMVPAVGVIVYFVAELLPGLLGSRGARQAVSGATKVFDPGRGLRAAQRWRYRRAPKTKRHSRTNSSSPASPNQRRLSTARR